MTQEDWQAVLAVMASAPLQNMRHAGSVDQLMTKVRQYAEQQERLGAEEAGPYDKPDQPTPVANFPTTEG